MPHPKFILKPTIDEQYSFNLTARNGQIILSSQTYVAKSSAITGIVLVQMNSPKDEHFTRNRSTNNQFYFTLKASNGLVIGTSEMYPSQEARDHGIESVKQNGSTKEVEDLTLALAN